jgi:hypothetical protein
LETVLLELKNQYMKTVIFLISTIISIACYSQVKSVNGSILSAYTNDCFELRIVFKDTSGKELDLGFSNELLDKGLSAFVNEKDGDYIVVNPRVTLSISSLREIICISGDNMDAGIVVKRVVPIVIGIKSR